MTDDLDDVRGYMRDFIKENFLYLHPEVELSDSDQFLELGVIDSLGFVELVEVVQHRFDVSVADVEVTEENFGSIDGIVDFVGRKRQVT